MPKRIDLTNQRFGKLVAISPTHKNGRTAWYCKCDCGNELDVFTFCLRNGNTQSCGCGQTNQIKDEVNNRYGRLVVKKFIGINNHHAEWECQCDCGNIIIAKGDLLRNGSVKSCGCLKRIDEINNKYTKLTVIGLDRVKDNIVYWKCKCECGNEISVAGNHLRSGHTKSCGCLKSLGETKINNILSQSQINYSSQYTVLIKPNYVRFDYAIYDDFNNLLRLVEFDGEQHFDTKSNWYENTHKNDMIKNQYCFENKIPLVRIPYWELDNLSLDLILGDKYLQ